MAAARDMLAEDMRVGQLSPTSFIEVEDDHHRHLFNLLFREAYEIIGKGI